MEKRHIDSSCSEALDGKHAAVKRDSGWECRQCSAELMAPCQSGLIGHTPAPQLTCISCDGKLINCDYCPIVELASEGVPDGWLSCHIMIVPRVEGKELSLIKGPTVCPFHREQLELMFKVPVRDERITDELL